jgi:hypothetical protein
VALLESGCRKTEPVGELIGRHCHAQLTERLLKLECERFVRSHDCSSAGNRLRLCVAGAHLPDAVDLEVEVYRRLSLRRDFTRTVSHLLSRSVYSSDKEQSAAQRSQLTEEELLVDWPGV